jgi:drug/metabolite transporter (DMT)-like permease
VSGAALALALASAVVHAAWNAVLADAEDPQAATAVALLAGALAFAPVAALTWDVAGSVAPYVTASAIAELAYIALLAAAYARAELSLVYPIARGTAPVLVLLVAGVTGAQQALGVLLVGAGVIAVRGLRAAGSSRDLAMALGIAACIATYTVIDRTGLHHAAAMPYLELELAPVAIVYAVILGAARVRAAVSWRALLAGVGLFGAYGLVLLALREAPAAAVAAVRETSVVFAVAFAALFLGERVGPARALGAVGVAAGVALVAT